MFEGDNEFYYTPNHLNTWEFAEKWIRRFGNTYQHGDGEKLREHRKTEVFKHLHDLKRRASKEELADIKKLLEEFIHVL